MNAGWFAIIHSLYGCVVSLLLHISKSNALNWCLKWKKKCSPWMHLLVISYFPKHEINILQGSIFARHMNGCMCPDMHVCITQLCGTVLHVHYSKLFAQNTSSVCCWEPLGAVMMEDLPLCVIGGRWLDMYTSRVCSGDTRCVFICECYGLLGTHCHFEWHYLSSRTF